MRYFEPEAFCLKCGQETSLQDAIKHAEVCK